MNISLPTSIIISGKPKSGKSHAIKYFMLENFNKFAYGVVFCRSKFDGKYNYIPDKFVHGDYNEGVLDNLMSIQKRIIENGYQPQEAFVIFDDCLDVFESATFKKLIVMYRHYHITIIIATQYINKVNPTVRECCAFALLFRTTTERSLEAITSSFGQQFLKHGFDEFLQAKTSNYQFILVDNDSSSEDITDIYQVMLCPKDIPKFQLKFKTKVDK